MGHYDFTIAKHKADTDSWEIAFVLHGDAANNKPQLAEFHVPLRPSADNAYDLGSPNYRWRDGYFAGRGIFSFRGTATPNLELGVVSGGQKITTYDSGSEIHQIFNWNGQGFFFGGGSGRKVRILKGNYGVAPGDPSVVEKFVIDVDTGRIELFGGFRTDVLPTLDNAYDLGSSSYRWRNVYAVNVSTGDLMFGNGWRIVEDDEHGLVIVSPDGKRFKLNLTPIEK